LAAGGPDGQRNDPYGRRFRAGFARVGESSTLPVGLRPSDRSPYGFLDIAGDVAELVWTPDSGEDYAVIKGGSYLRRAAPWERHGVRVAAREIGFRLAIEAPPAEAWVPSKAASRRAGASRASTPRD